MPDEMSQDQGKLLLEMARDSIAEKLSIQRAGQARDRRGTDNSFLDRKQGVFVTLHKLGRLRGCIGTIEPVSAIREAVCENAVSAAFRDSRFTPLLPGEFHEIDIEVSVLSTPAPLSYNDPSDLLARLTPHRDGVVLKKGFHKATFLPQVWDQLPSPREFLSQLCVKAGVAGDAWEHEDLSISVYSVQSFCETLGNANPQDQ